MISQITNDLKLLELLDKYNPIITDNSTSVSEVIKKLSYNVNNPELIVPVLGSQGMGKSTLINAILGSNILPNDADETTCVPVEIRYGEQEKAIVYFQSDESIEIELSCDSLRRFVDNNENEGNEKCVSHIALQTPNNLLKEGLVIVDLPGVGSLTKNNQETTMRYIRKLCTAIFVIPTVPTIRRSEEIFIRGAWSSFSSAIFVQNRWDDETDEEVNDSVEFNSQVLRKIAKDAKTIFTGKICVVNAYKAILGRMYNNEDECTKSNLPELIQELENLSANRIKIEETNFINKVLTYINTAESIIMQLIKESEMDEEQLKLERQRILDEFETATKNMQKLVDDIVIHVNLEKGNADIFAKKISRTTAENLRADIRKLIDGGIVDGSQLTEAFSDYQNNYLLDAIEQHYDYTSQLTYELSKKLEILAEKVQVERASSFESQKFENGQAFKFEKGLEVGIDIAGAIGGFQAGITVGTWAGAKLGTMIGSFGGPVGAVIGFFAGIGISAIAGMFGKKTKQEITARRGSQAKRAIEPYIEEFQDKLYSTFSESTNSVLNETVKVLNTYINDRREYCENMMISKEKALNDEHQNKIEISVLNEHYKYLENKKEFLG